MQIFEHDADGLMIRLAEGTPHLSCIYDDEDDAEQRLAVTFPPTMSTDPIEPSIYELRMTRQQAEDFAQAILDRVAGMKASAESPT